MVGLIVPPGMPLNACSGALRRHCARHETRQLNALRPAMGSSLTSLLFSVLEITLDVISRTGVLPSTVMFCRCRPRQPTRISVVRPASTMTLL